MESIFISNKFKSVLLLFIRQINILFFSFKKKTILFLSKCNVFLKKYKSKRLFLDCFLSRFSPSCVSSLNCKGSPTAIVVVGRSWYLMTRRTRLSRVCSAGRYSMGTGCPDLIRYQKSEKSENRYTIY